MVPSHPIQTTQPLSPPFSSHGGGGGGGGGAAAAAAAATARLNLLASVAISQTLPMPGGGIYHAPATGQMFSPPSAAAAAAASASTLQTAHAAIAPNTTGGSANASAMKRAEILQMKAAHQSISLLCAKALNVTGSHEKMDLEELLKTLLSEKAAQEGQIRSLQKRSSDQHKIKVQLQQTLPFAKEERSARDAHAVTLRQIKGTELQEIDRMKRVFKEMEGSFLCSALQDVAQLPKVSGFCGHIIDESSLKSLDDVAFARLTNFPGGASARQHLFARRCPPCTGLILGGGFNVTPLKEIISLSQPIFDALKSESPEKFRRAIEESEKNLNQIEYQIPSLGDHHISTMQQGVYSYTNMAEYSVNKSLSDPRISNEEWDNGVWISFTAQVNRVFFEAYVATLNGKGKRPETGNLGINVLVNATRTLACQFLYSYVDPKVASEKIAKLELSLKGLKEVAAKNLQEKINAAEQAIARAKTFLPVGNENLNRAVKAAVAAEKEAQKVVNPKTHLCIIVDTLGNYTITKPAASSQQPAAAAGASGAGAGQPLSLPGAGAAAAANS